jgi:hypothetical protein
MAKLPRPGIRQLPPYDTPELSGFGSKSIPDDVRQVSVGGKFAEALMSHRATGSEDEPGPDLTRTGESALDKKWNLPLEL